MANLIFDLMDLNYGMNSMKDSSVLLSFNLKKKNELHISLVSINLYLDFNGLYLFILFCSVFTFVPSL